MQKSTVNGLQATGVIVEKRRIGIGVEVDVGMGAKVVGVVVATLCGVSTGAQEARRNIRIVNNRFIERAIWSPPASPWRHLLRSVPERG